VKALYEKFEFAGFSSASRTFGALLKDDAPLNDMLKELMIEHDVSPDDYRTLLATKLYDGSAAYAEHHKADEDLVGHEIWTPEDARRWLRRTPVSAMMHFKTYTLEEHSFNIEEYDWNAKSYRDSPIFVGLGDLNTCYKLQWKNGKYTCEENTRRGIRATLDQEHNIDTYYKQIAQQRQFKFLFDVLKQWVVFK
jgi:hypothetical protein